MPDVTVIIIAYNPYMKVFRRCLKAAAAMDRDPLEVEYLLIDNNSQPGLSTYKEVQEFLAVCPNSRVIVEKRQGSGYALLCGFANSQAPVIVTFGDDNEPESSYLLQAKELMDKYPQTGVFGPGIVKVDYLEGAPAYFEKFRYVFQETSTEEEKVTNSRYPDNYYPYGTGMVVRKEVAMDYYRKVEEGIFTSMGRIGKVLTSCEDLQLVWNCIRNLQLSVGRSPGLKLNHLINAKKANFTYWKKLSYGGGFSWLPARFEVFPEEISSVRNTGGEVRKSCLRIAKVFVFNFYKPRFFLISVASQAGILDSIYYINKKKTPFYLNWVRTLLGLGK